MAASLDLNDIALFVQVVRSGSFAEAARRLDMPANTVSRRIQGLEDKVGTRLLQRSTRKLTLTSAGEALHERCAASIDGLVDAGQELMSGTDEASGLVRVAAPADFFDFFEMEWLAAFLDQHPRVRMDFVLSDASTDLIAERIDVAFRGGPLRDSRYVGRKLHPAGSNGLVASPLYLAAHGAPTQLSDLENHQCLGFTQPGGILKWRLQGPDGLEEEVRLQPRLSASTAQALRKATVAGLGIALLPSTMARIDLNAGRVVPVLSHYTCEGHGVNVLYPSRRHLPKAVSAFIDLVMEKTAYLGVSPAVVESGRAR
ncbi:LysR family transcriptional regulator [Luteimonas sp. R10]|uniref:LysR family transcriptional regulator n=1 Tax=Luteimonas sp. R10 TaxID=3108176 RepID=UPI0030926722|nr:LysR family transcriptional regulator [Luteimonas sp. R10]